MPHPSQAKDKKKSKKKKKLNAKQRKRKNDLGNIDLISIDLISLEAKVDGLTVCRRGALEVVERGSGEGTTQARGHCREGASGT